jgi:hypothetical protein
MTTQIKSLNDGTGHSRGFYDVTTAETVARFQPCLLDEDFLGAGHASIPSFGAPATGYPWMQKTVKMAGSPAVAVVANSAAGIVQLALDATAEAQEATLYANDQRNWDVTKNLAFETRAGFGVVPGALVEAVFGLQSAWVSGPDNAAEYVRFQALASGLVNMQSFDGTNVLTASTGVTLAAGAFHVFRIDAADLTNLRFFIDGVEVSTSHYFSFGATGAGAVLQPYFSVYKPSGTGTGTLQVDAIQVATDRV